VIETFSIAAGSAFLVDLQRFIVSIMVLHSRYIHTRLCHTERVELRLLVSIHIRCSIWTFRVVPNVI